MTLSFSKIATKSKNDSALRWNQLGVTFGPAFKDFEKFIYDAGVVVASHGKHNIERATQERQSDRMCRSHYLDARHTGLKLGAVRGSFENNLQGGPPHDRLGKVVRSRLIGTAILRRRIPRSAS